MVKHCFSEELSWANALGVVSGEEPCRAPLPTTSEVQNAGELFTFLSQEFHGWKHADFEEPIDAIVVLSNWYDRVSKVKKVLELAVTWQR